MGALPPVPPVEPPVPLDDPPVPPDEPPVPLPSRPPVPSLGLSSPQPAIARAAVRHRVNRRK